MKRVAILGSTGSIGVQTLDIIRRHPGRLEVVGLAAHRNHEQIQRQAAEFGVSAIALMDEAAGRRAEVPSGMSAIVEIATLPQADIVVVAISGVAGLLPTLAAIAEGKQIALASKEVLVAAGQLVMPLAREKDILLTPIDSEHSAIFQCIQGVRPDQLDGVILTASGGPFRGRKRSELTDVTIRDALNHPTWKMGGKITVDSATLMNKGLELIEAKWLFGLPMHKIEVVVHPESIVHSFVRLTDGSVLAQLGRPDMRLPIQYALLYPERIESGMGTWSPLDTPSLHFESPDIETFPALNLARESARIGGTAPCVLNAANEEAAAAFLRGQCGFLQITDVVAETMVRHAPGSVDLDNLLDADRWARETVRALLKLD